MRTIFTLFAFLFAACVSAGSLNRESPSQPPGEFMFPIRIGDNVYHLFRDSKGKVHRCPIDPDCVNSGRIIAVQFLKKDCVLYDACMCVEEPQENLNPVLHREGCPRGMVQASTPNGTGCLEPDQASRVDSLEGCRLVLSKDRYLIWECATWVYIKGETP